MEAEQVHEMPATNTLQAWWDGAIFDGKEYCDLAPDGTLQLRATPFSEARTIGQLTLLHAEPVIKALRDKFPEVAAKAEELRAEWDHTEDKLKLAGKVSRLRDYLLLTPAIGDFAPLYKLAAGWDNTISSSVEANYKIKADLVEKAEALCAGSAWKETPAALREIGDAWKAAGYVDKQRNDDLWNRLEAARNQFFERKRSHQESQENEMLQNLDLKMEIVAKAEQLAASESWKETTETFKSLMDQWKSTGRTMNDKNEALWQRFISAKNAFFDKKRQHFETIQKEQEVNLARKTELIEKAVALSNSTDWNGTSAAYAALLEDWKSTGRVPTEKTEELWERFNQAREIFFTAKRQHFEHFKVSMADNLAQKTALVKRAEALRNSSQWREATDELNELMTEWKKIGPVPKAQADTLWEQFITARRSFFERKDADRDQRKLQAEQRAEGRNTQARQFLERLKEELKEEADKLEGFREGIANLTTGPREEELRRHLEKLIAQTEPKVKRKEEKIAEVEQQLRALQGHKGGKEKKGRPHTPKPEGRLAGPGNPEGETGIDSAERDDRSEAEDTDTSNE